MDDKKIIELFFVRDEAAIDEIRLKYGKYCDTIANNILGDSRDADECVSDAYLKLWNAIPPKKPQNLLAYLAKIVRNDSLTVMRRESRLKRGGRNTSLCFEELEDCLPSGDMLEITPSGSAAGEITAAINEFLARQPKNRRYAFVRRYFWADTPAQIAQQTSSDANAVAALLYRMRGELKALLEKKQINF